MKSRHWILTGLCAVCVACAAPSEELFKKKVLDSMEGVASFRQQGSASWEILDRNGRTQGRLFLEEIDDSQRKMGFGGTIEVALTTDAAGEVITGVLVGKNHETPRFMERVEAAGFLRRWNGMSLKEASKANVDAVSRATYSSSAIAFGVRQLAAKLLSGPSAPPRTREELQTEITRLEASIARRERLQARCGLLATQWRGRRTEELLFREKWILERRQAALDFAKAKGLSVSEQNMPSMEAETTLGKAVASFRVKQTNEMHQEIRRMIAADLDERISAISSYMERNGKQLADERGQVKRLLNDLKQTRL